MPFDFFRPIVSKDQSQGLLTVKYQPTRLEQIAGHTEILATLQNYLRSGNLPNMIITGPPGVGKKATIDCLTRSFLGEFYKTDQLTIEGSIDRGKNVVSEKQQNKKNSNQHNDNNIINFLKKRTGLPNNLFKIITIYDFDHMTTEAQMALRRVIEKQSAIARFIFVANDHNDIIEAIQSRAVIIKFDRLENETIHKVLTDIIKQESLNRDYKMKIPEELVELILLASYGDLKQALTYLQVILQSPNHSVSDFYQIFNLPYLTEIVKLIRCACIPDRIEHQSDEAYKILDTLLKEGYQAVDLLDIFFKVLMFNHVNLTSDQQANALEHLSKCFFRVEQTGSNNQLYGLLADWITSK